MEPIICQDVSAIVPAADSIVDERNRTVRPPGDECLADSEPIPLSRRDWLTAIALAVGVLVFSTIRIVPGVCGNFGDDAIYVITAKSLAEGRGYRLLHLPGEPHQTKYPILYPALLAIVWMLWPSFPDNLLAMKGLTSLCGALALGLSYLYLVRFRYASRWLALTAGLLSLSTSGFIFYCTHTLTEMPFALLCVTAFWELETQARAPSSSSRRQFLLGVGLAVLFACRTVGGVLALAGVTYLFCSRKPVRWVVLGTALTLSSGVVWMLGDWGGWQRDPVIGYDTDYLGWWVDTWATLPRVVGINLVIFTWCWHGLYLRACCTLTPGDCSSGLSCLLWPDWRHCGHAALISGSVGYCRGCSSLICFSS